MTPADLLERIATGESQTLEFKSSFDKASIESLVAFANAQGGTVLVGVTDAAIVQGVTFAQKQPEAPRGGVNGGASGGVSGGVTPPESAHLLQLIQTQPGLKTAELVVQTGKSQRTIERWLKQLKENGLIEFRGVPKTGGYYRIQ